MRGRKKNLLLSTQTAMYTNRKGNSELNKLLWEKLGPNYVLDKDEKVAIKIMKAKSGLIPHMIVTPPCQVKRI